MMQATGSAITMRFTAASDQCRDPVSGRVPQSSLDRVSSLSQEGWTGHPSMTPRHITQERHQTDGRIVKRPRRARNEPANTSRDPIFWDTLSKVWLTRAALQEIDRRSELHQATKRSPPDLGEKANIDTTYFARHGGPDLSHLRNVCVIPVAPFHVINC